MAKKTDLLVIICKTSGSQKEVAPEFEKILKKSIISYKIKLVPDPTKIADYIKTNLNDIPVIAVYGGDGTVVETMKSLIGTSAKLLILPGGTANVVALDLGLPATAAEVLRMYAEGRFRATSYDIAKAGTQPLVLDVHSGWWSEAVRDAPVDLKKRIGVAAYGLTAIKKLPKASRELYVIKVNGKQKKIKGYALLVANQGFQNFLTVSLFPYAHRTGMVQVAIIKSLSPLRLSAWFLAKLFTGRAWSRVIRTYRADSVEIIKSPKEVIYDDVTSNLELPVKIVGGHFQVKVLVPPTPVRVSKLRSAYISSRLLIHRQLERLRSYISGTPKFEYSRISPHLYVGGRYRKDAYSTFERWGVTGIVNMRSVASTDISSRFEHLHLKTQDWHAPDISLLKQGVDFIGAHIDKGGSVYVHCRQGEGRGPTMAAAYLISQGLTVEEALAHIKKSRPMAHPNRSQVKQLARWQQSLSKK